MSRQCQFCGAPMNVGDPIPRDAECDACRRDLRCCRNCRFYDVRYNNSCRESSADPVEDKDRRNFCEYFSFSDAPYRSDAAATTREAGARAKLDALFGGSGPTPDPKQKLDSLFGPAAPAKDRVSEARSKLDSLFGKPKDSDDE
jgi:hypothetical protein